jgi:DNA-directed RNA polymerase subunit RPC12/RpoP
MPEVKIEVKRMLMHYKCDKCDGYMLLQPKKPVYGATNNILKYFYKCSDCGVEKTMSKVYPMVGDEIPDDIPMPNIQPRKNKN